MVSIEDIRKARKSLTSIKTTIGLLMFVSICFLVFDTIHPKLIIRLKQIKFKNYYGFVPLVDNPNDKESISRRLNNLTKLACLNTGGNVGCCAWIFAEYMGNSSKIGAIGYDYSYYSNVPYNETQTYNELVELAGSNSISNFFVSSKSIDGREFYQDPTFYWYCDNFLNLIAQCDRPLYNLTDAGLLYGQNVINSKVESFLDG